MFTEYFGFTKNPFNLAADLSCFCLDSDRQELVDNIVTNLHSDTKPIVLTGSIGIGKTLLVKYLQPKLPTHLECIYLAESSITYSERIHTLISTLPKILESGTKSLIILDNAHEIPLIDLQFLLADTLSQSSFQIMLVGLTDLTNKLYSIDRDFFADKKSHSYRMIGLTDQQVKAYIKFRLNQAGYCEKTKGKLFSDGALRILTDLSQGIPHSINLLCGAALLIASFDNKHQVSTEIAQEATLSCLLPAEITEEKILASFSDSQPMQAKAPVSLGKRSVRVRRQGHQRIKNWKRIVNIHYRFPVTSAVIPPSNTELVNSRRKRLKNGVAVLGFSLCCLIGLQQMDNVNPGIQPGMHNSANYSQLTSNNKNQIAFSSIKGEVAKQMASLDLSQVMPKPASRATSDEKLIVASAEASAKSVIPEIPAMENQPVQQQASPSQKQVATPVIADSHKAITDKKHLAVVAVNSHELLVKLEKNHAKPLPKPKVEPIKVLAKNDIDAIPVSEKNPKFEHVSAKMIPELISTPAKSTVQPINTVLDAQEIAARDRAASRLNLYRLGIEYNADALMAAAQSGNVHVLRLLLASGVSPNIKNSQGETALIKAASKGYKSAVKELLSAGAHPNIKDHNGLTALMHANQNNRLDVKSLLLSHGAQG
jgi:type II secretory pathway predicted ATPase ExeA